MKKIALVTGSIILVVLLAAAVGFHFAVAKLKDRVVAALGAGSELKALNVHWSSIEMVALRAPAPKGWPTARTLEAERITLVPSLRSLLSNDVKIASVEIERPYISAYRTPGKIGLVPTLLHTRETPDPKASARTVTIDRIAVHDGVMEIYDATVGQKVVKTRLEAIEATVKGVVAPVLSDKAEFVIDAIVKGTRRDGKAKVTGWVAQRGRDSSSRIVLDGLDLVSLQPYLARKGDVRVERGNFDLDLKSEVRNNQLDGKGKVVIRELQLGQSGGFAGTFMGVPRNAVLNSLKDHNGAIDLDFTLKGDLSHPTFSLNEALSTRIAAGLAGQLGVSVKGLVEGVGGLGQKGVEGVGQTAGGIGAAIKDIFK
ncbi:MAG TPA: DUF748 domain-containing protein [Candidatus Binatia bacterium]|nr:DUF748 domain-containing protein [Candidatus Binatia bacterium]